MSVSPFPPIPAAPDVERAAPYGDFVESAALLRLVLGSMPATCEPGRLVNGRPPRGEFAGFGEGMVPVPVEVPLAFPAAVSRHRPQQRRAAADRRDPAWCGARLVAAAPVHADRVAAGEVTDRPVAAAGSVRSACRRPPAPWPAMADRRAAPPRLRRPVADPEDAFGVSQPRMSGVWVLISSAAASIVLLVLTSVGVNRYGPGRNEPAADPALQGVSETVAERPEVSARPSRLAATGERSF